MGKAEIKVKGGGEDMSGVRSGISVKGMGKDQEKLEVCQSTRWARYSRG